MVKVIVGLMGSSVAKGASALSTPEGVSSFLSVVSSHKITELDTARVYAGGQSETLLGEVNACSNFKVATKAPAFMPNSLSEQKILSNAQKSFDALKTEKIDLYYLHGPDRSTPLTEQIQAINKLHKEGRFNRFGVSNISDAEVQEIYSICEREGYGFRPSVYQGGYNPIGRGPEKTLFPLLQKLNMNFYAFSPLGGGLLAKPISQLMKPEKGTRFDEMKVFGDIYLTPPIISGLEKVQKACDDEGISLMEATMRWFMHHSVLNQWEGNGVILGASSNAQIESSLSACEKGPLSEKLQNAWEELYNGIKDNLPNYHS